MTLEEAIQKLTELTDEAWNKVDVADSLGLHSDELRALGRARGLQEALTLIKTVDS
jgi:hypothetical protein